MNNTTDISGNTTKNNSKNNILDRLERFQNTPPAQNNHPDIAEDPRPTSTLTQGMIAQLKLNAANVVQCTLQSLPHEIELFFTSNNLEKKLLTNIELKGLSDDIKIKTGCATGNELVGLSQAICGISETGTLALTSSSQNPTSINFLVDWHLVLLRENEVVKNLNQGMSVLDAKNLTDSRAINFISGPSRTADIQQTIQLGAHGPRHLWVFIIKED